MASFEILFFKPSHVAAKYQKHGVWRTKDITIFLIYNSRRIFFCGLKISIEVKYSLYRPILFRSHGNVRHFMKNKSIETDFVYHGQFYFQSTLEFVEGTARFVSFCEMLLTQIISFIAGLESESKHFISTRPEPWGWVFGLYFQ